LVAKQAATHIRSNSGVRGGVRSTQACLQGPYFGDVGVTCSRLRYRLPSPTSSIVEEDEVIMDNKYSILPSSIAAPLIWDMDGGSGAMKGP
jgi:hypothetical protein